MDDTTSLPVTPLALLALFHKAERDKRWCFNLMAS